MTSTPDLAAIRARANAATPGVWCIMPSLGTAGTVLGRWSVDTLPDAPDDVNISYQVNTKTDAEFIAYSRTDVPALLDALEAAEAENQRLRTAVQEAYDAVMTVPDDGGSSAILFDALELDGAPQDGGVTDPHNTSGPPEPRNFGPEENGRILHLLNRWTAMHSMTVTRGTLDAIDRGEDISVLLDAECARLVEHECGWQTERRALAHPTDSKD